MKIDENYKCKYCGEKVCNGVGPSGMPTVTTILNKLPSSHVFFIDACRHDVDYHEQIGKKLADKLFLLRQKASAWKKYPVVEREHWYSWLNPKRAISALGTSWAFTKRRGLILAAYRNYYFVVVKGAAAYAKGTCEKMIKKTITDKYFQEKQI